MVFLCGFSGVCLCVCVLCLCVILVCAILLATSLWVHSPGSSEQKYNTRVVQGEQAEVQHESLNNNLELVIRKSAGALGPHYFAQSARKEGERHEELITFSLPILLVVQFIK